MEIEGLANGEFDRLIDMDRFDFNGTLEIVFSYAAIEGDTFELFDFTSFTGAFGDIVVTGLGSSLALDTTQLATTGMFVVVPEPMSLTLCGLGALMFARRRRR